MSHTERGEDAAGPSHSVTDWHSLRDVLEDKPHDEEEPTCHEVNKERGDLGVDV